MIQIESLNRTLFLQINAGIDTPGWKIQLVTGMADFLIYGVPLMLLFMWLSGVEVKRQLAIKAFCVAMLGVGINQLIGMTWQHPRPFMVGIGHTFIPHAADSSFPSDHATVLFGTSLTLLFACAIRSGLALLLIGLCVAWARLFLGVHFPFDMLGAAAVACVALMIVNPVWKAFGADIVVIVEKAYRTALGKPIALGWLRR